MVKRRSEFIIYLILFVLFGISFIRQSPLSDYYLSYSISLWIGTGLMLGITRYLVAPLLMKRNILIPLLTFSIAISVTYLVPAYFNANYQADIADINTTPMFHPIVVLEIIPYILAATMIGFVYLIKLKKSVVKKTLYILSTIILLVAVSFIVKYFVDTGYKGDGSIKFLNKEYNSLQEILAQKQFTNKIVYIDLWYSSCAPCIKEFKALPSIKKELINNNVEFLYLARETSHPNSKQLWKNAIREYNLEGWHVYMDNDLKAKVWELIEENTEDISRAYPHYLLVNKEGIFIVYNANKPTDGQSLINQIRRIDN